MSRLSAWAGRGPLRRQIFLSGYVAYGYDTGTSLVVFGIWALIPSDGVMRPPGCDERAEIPMSVDLSRADLAFYGILRKEGRTAARSGDGRYQRFRPGGTGR